MGMYFPSFFLAMALVPQHIEDDHSWKTRNTIFCCGRVKNVPLWKKSSEEYIVCIEVIPEFCSVSN